MRWRHLSYVVLAVILRAPLAAQQEGETPQPPGSTEDKKPPTPEHTGVHALFRDLGEDYKNLWHLDNLVVAGLGGGAALAIHPWDQEINAHLRSHYDLVDDIYAPGKYYGGTPVQVALSIGTYTWGRIFDQPKVSHLGMDLLRAQIIAESIVEPLKFSVGRERPDGSNNQSFPSGHAAATFAAATVLERHLGWKNAALAYVVAAYVASSRLHDNVHYASDVVFGSAIGVLSGRTVTQHGAAYWTFVPARTPDGGIVILMAHFGDLRGSQSSGFGSRQIEPGTDNR